MTTDMLSSISSFASYLGRWFPTFAFRGPRAVVVLIGSVLAATGMANETSEQGRISVKQITFGPNHHFFGYIGQSRTIPWSGDGRYILTLQTTFQDRMPGKGDAANVCVIDTRDNYRVIVLDTSEGWNPQQGTMFYWNPEHPETQFFFNDRDRETGKVFTVLYDLNERRRIREYRFDGRPVANGGIAQNGGYFTAINYARMARLRPVTGYKDAWDWTEGVLAPEDDGIFRVDIRTGERTLIVSFAQLKAMLVGVDPGLEERDMFINHTLNNRNNDLIYFYCRADFEGDREKRLNVPFTVRPDGTGLTRHDVFIGGHPEWEFGSRIIGDHMIGGQRMQVVYDVALRRITEIWGGSDVFPNPGGDISLAPDGRWFVNGYKHGESDMRYTFLHRPSGRILHAPPLSLGEWRTGDLRVDPAPSWNRTGTQVLSPGIAPDGTRQIFIFTIHE